MDGLQVFFLLLHYSASTLFPFSCFTGLRKKKKPDMLHIPCKNLNYRGICEKCNSHHSPKAPPHPRPCPVNHADCSFPWKESQTQMSPGAKVGNERSLDIDDRLVLDWGNLENKSPVYSEFHNDPLNTFIGWIQPTDHHFTDVHSCSCIIFKNSYIEI